MSDPSLQRAAHLLEVRRPREAMTALAGVLREEPEHAAALRLLSRAHTDLGEDELAESSARAAVASDPDDPAGHARLAVVLLDRGDPGAATASARRAVELDPSDLAGLRILAQSLAGLRRGGRDALAVARRTLDLAPDDARSWSVLGVVEQRRGHPRRATAAYRRALELDPTDPVTRHNAALLRRSSRAALVDMGEALALDPLDRHLVSSYRRLVDRWMVVTVVALLLVLRLLAQGEAPWPAYVVAVVLWAAVLVWRYRRLPRAARLSLSESLRVRSPGLVPLLAIGAGLCVVAAAVVVAVTEPR